jgi:hypothetical protein
VFVSAIPTVVGLTLCDQVIVEQGTEKVSLIGSFSGISAPEFPALALPFSVFATFTDGLGEVTIDLVFIRLESGEESYSYRGVLSFPGRLKEVRFHARINQCLFPAAGEYDVMILANGQWLGQKRLHVRRRE